MYIRPNKDVEEGKNAKLIRIKWMTQRGAETVRSFLLPLFPGAILVKIRNNLRYKSSRISVKTEDNVKAKFCPTVS